MAPADFERLWNKVVDFVCIKSSMDAALDNPEARAEVSAAVESVLPQYAMPRFVGLPADEKAAQMDEVSSIVLGICALNQSLGRGGLCLPGTASVASYMHQANRLATEVEREIAEVHSGIQEYLLVVRAESAREEPTSPRLQRLRQELTNLQQELAYLGQLREDLLRGIDVVSQQDADRQHLLAELKEVVGGRSAIPKEQVYPLFDDLGNLTSSLIDSSKMLEVQGKLLEALLGLVGGFSRSIRPVELDRAQAFLE